MAIKLNLGQKFTIPTLLIIIISFSSFTFYLIAEQKTKSFERIQKNAERITRLIAMNSRSMLWNLEEERLKENSKTYFEDESITLIRVKDLSAEPLLELKRNVKGDNDITKVENIIYDKKRIGVVELVYTSYYIDQNFKEIQYKMIGLVTAVVLIILVTLFTTSIVVLKPMGRMFHVLNRVSKKDLTEKIDVKSNDEIGKFAAFINDFVGKLQDIISEISVISSKISKSSVGLAKAMEKIMEGGAGENDMPGIRSLLAGMESVMGNVQDQAACTEQTSASVYEISESIVNVAENTTHTKTFSAETTENARMGGASVEKTMNSFINVEKIVKDIEDKSIKLGESSSKIGEILTVIGDIAEQTNLLALNAAIEAARAGEAGKGFAVVSDEIQKLAGNSQNATSEIDTLVKGIQKEIEDVVETITIGYGEVRSGAKIAKEAKENLANIISKMEMNNKEIEDIALAIDEQSTAIKEIRDAINTIATGSEEIESASREQIEGLKEMANVYEGVLESSTGLARISTELNNIVQSFQLSPINNVDDKEDKSQKIENEQIIENKENSDQVAEELNFDEKKTEESF